MFDNSKIRKDFPILDRLIEGKPIVYLDSTASSLKPKVMIEAENEYYTKYCVNIFRGLYKLSEEATWHYEEARERVAQFIGTSNPKEIVFVRNATEAINLVCYSWGRVNIDEKSEIVTTLMEHHANFVTWQQLAFETGATIKFIDFDNDGYLDIKSLERSITKRTKLIAITHISNVLGTINPIKEIVEKVKKINPKTVVLVDAAQSVPHMKVNVKELGCDFLAFSSHKMLGPTGTGVLWGKYEHLEAMLPFQMGGEMIKEVSMEKTKFNDPPYRFEAGTPHIAGVMGLKAAIDYLDSIGMENIHQHEKELLSYTLKRLADFKNISIYGPRNIDNKCGIVAFNFPNVHPHDVAQVLDSENICIRSGHHCAMPLHIRLQISASCRASFYIYNTKQDIDTFISALQKTLKIFHE